MVAQNAQVQRPILAMTAALPRQLQFRLRGTLGERQLPMDLRPHQPPSLRPDQPSTSTLSALLHFIPHRWHQEGRTFLIMMTAGQQLLLGLVQQRHRTGPARHRHRVTRHRTGLARHRHRHRHWRQEARCRLRGRLILYGIQMAVWYSPAT